VSLKLGKLAAIGRYMREARWLLLAVAPALSGCPEAGVVRVMEGREVEGRFINERAYALYAVGAEAEVRGDLPTALRAYDAAAAEDDGSVEIWTRIAAVLCRAGDAVGAADAFERATGYDAEYEPLWRERARCELSRGRADQAVRAAQRAVELDPDRDETVVLHAQALERAGKRQDARRALVALTIRHNRSVEAWRALYEHARRTGDTAWADRAARQLRELAPMRARGGADGAPLRPPLSEIDAALAADDLPTARRRAKAARVTASELAVRAAALGRSATARAQAELVLGADPSDGAARVALAVAADLTREDAVLARAMAELPPARDGTLNAVSPLARLLFAELLQRRVGGEAAQAWLGSLAPRPAPPDDLLLAQVDQRVQAKLGRR
jgi:Tfp pilus assembly protein PilF